MPQADAFVAAYHEVLNPQYPSALAWRDEEGRLLGEGNAPRELVRQEAIEWRPSRYPGSRYRHSKPINASALKQLTRHWDEVLELVRATRHGYVRRYGVPAALRVADLWRFSRFTVTIPNYLRNRPGGTDTAVPAVASTAFKSVAGIFIVTADMAFRDVEMDGVLTPDQVIDYADAHGLFTGAFGVCAGPPHLMRTLLDAVVARGDGPGGSECALEQLTGDVERFFRYAALYTMVEFTKQAAVFEVQRRIAMLYRRAAESAAARDSVEGRRVLAAIDARAGSPGLARRLVTDPAFTTRLVGVLERQLRELRWWADDRYPPLAAAAPGGGTESLHPAAALSKVVTECGALEEEALTRLTSLQREIGELLGRAAPPRELRAADARRVLGPTATEWLQATV